MSFLGTIGNIATSAVSRALGKETLNLPFTIGEPILEQDPGSHTEDIIRPLPKDDNAPVSVFLFDCVKHKDRLPLARNALKRFKTLRHPDLLKFIDGGETDAQIVIGTEPVKPLRTQLNDEVNPNFIAWGLYKTASALKFINQDCSLAHGNVRISSIYTTKAGEWRLCGFELLGSLKEESNILYEWGPRIIESKYAPPELTSSNWFSAQGNPVTAIDAWAYACLIYEIFNGPLSRREEMSRIGAIPKPLASIYRGLCNPNPKLRQNFADLLEQGQQHNGYFFSDFIKASVFLEQISVKDSHEKEQFLKNLGNSLDSFPADYCMYKILPELINAIEFGGASAKTLNLITKVGERLTPEEYETMIVPCIIRLFSSPDRAMRVTLCENLGTFGQHISNKLANEKIFPNIATGFMDTSAVVRESTLKAVLVIIPKLSERIINNDLLRFLAKLQTDEEAGIRANTTICLGKLSKFLNDATKKRVLIPAFTRSLHDPFPPARNAGLLAFAATSDCYEPEDIAKKVIPATSFLLIDPEKSVRNQAFKNLDVFVKRMEKHAQSIPEVVPENTSSSSPSRQPEKTDASSDGWAGWAMGAISTRLVGAATSGPLSPTTIPAKPDAPSSPSRKAQTTEERFAPPTAVREASRQTFSTVGSDGGGGWDDEQDEWGKADDTKSGSVGSPKSSSGAAKTPQSPVVGGDGDDREAARKAKKEQLAALREQKKAALAAKKLAQGN
ncbi:hypothetical protein HDU67_003323 [Dinochytrium kinnereticum]|nr:hypothetical protein HDU67_003323 [Dinochytrium kinnereticum]